MKTLQEKINELIKETYSVHLSATADVSVDDYNEGEGECVNFIEFSNIRFNVDQDELDYLKKEIIDYIEYELLITYNPEHIKDCLISNDSFYLSNLVDVDNTVPSETQIENWKESKETLYVQNINLSVKINSVELTNEMILEILELNDV